MEAPPDTEGITAQDEVVYVKKAKKEKKETKQKKRKVIEEGKGDANSNRVENSVMEANGGAKDKIMKTSDVDDDVVESGDEKDVGEDPNAVSRLRVSEVLRKALESKGVQSLLPIPARIFDVIRDGSDLVGQGRIEQGKHLAFVLPILESLASEHNKTGKSAGYGRSPSVLVLVPTTELANQIHSCFEFYGEVLGLDSCCLFGGSPYEPQNLALKRGADIVVGTPGRIKNHIEKETLDLISLKFLVLDEADEMLKMGFEDDVQLILQKVEDPIRVQTVLFSTALPEWVEKISTKFLKPTKEIVVFAGDEKLEASANVRHLVLRCSHSARSNLIPDLIHCYNRGGRTIIFTETEDDAAKLAGLFSGTHVLHRDIAQAQREAILSKFRSGRFLVMVATSEVAAGLDFNNVRLIIQCEAPRDVKNYLRLSWRTGRAGNSCIAILLCEPKYSHIISRIESGYGVKFEHITAPQPADVAELAGSEVSVVISEISDSVVPVFRSQAEQLLSSSGLSPVDLIAKLLAKAAGYTAVKRRSLLSSKENYVALFLHAGTTMYSPSFAFGFLRKYLSDDKVNRIKGLSLTADRKGAVFDVPDGDVNFFIEGLKSAKKVTIEVLKEIPPLLLQNSDRGKGGNGGQGRASRGSSDGKGGNGKGHDRRS